MKTDNEILGIMSGTLGKSIIEYISYKRALGKKIGRQQIYDLRICTYSWSQNQAEAYGSQGNFMRNGHLLKRGGKKQLRTGAG